ncbi:cytochrome c [Poseidonocella sp. HB161398]|uniref:cytochrome c n=1 Tax=Poseidonocella sp. HB161398 TaxID=2320855 RepID=UPI00148724A5|nr:cytochrome c [Poseidonocella sp. HB161398]
MKLSLTVLALAAAAGIPAAAHQKATGVVKERMELMERFDELADRIFAMMHGELAYDPAAVRRAAEEISEGAGPHLTSLFPEGSSGAPSEAKAAIWRDFSRFENDAAALADWSRALAAQADRRPEGRLPKDWEDAVMGPGMMRGGGMMGNGGPVSAAWHVAAVCNACHAAFREED